MSVCPRSAKKRRREGDLRKAGVVVVVVSCCQSNPFARVTTGIACSLHSDAGCGLEEKREKGILWHPFL